MKNAAIYDRQLYYRIIALWVLCEAMLGGIIHGLHIPVSGLVIGSAAVICISLIAHHAPVRGAIIKATIIVAVFKMMLSPQAPVFAYVAVFFQGALGELLFWNRKFFRLSCLLLGFLALLESGFQRIILVTLVYGSNLWKAINDFFGQPGGNKNFVDYSLYLIVGYVSLHVAAGLVVGWWAGIIPEKIGQWQAGVSKLDGHAAPLPISNQQPGIKHKRFKLGLVIIWVALILLYCQSSLNIGNPMLPASTVLRMLIRSLLIVLSWYFLLGPVTGWLLRNWLQKKQASVKTEMSAVAEILPVMKNLLQNAWKLAAAKKGASKIIYYAKLVLAKSLSPQIQSPIFILAGEIHSGKTSALMQWIENRCDARGVLTPVIKGKRFFLDIHTKEQFPMEANNGEDYLSVGRYQFSRSNFEKARDIIQNSVHYRGWLIIDEVGPLELNGDGFYEVLIQRLNSYGDQKILLVVRNSLVEDVQNRFGLKTAPVVRSTDELEAVKPGVVTI